MAGTYLTAMEGSLRAPFVIRWPGKVLAGRVNNEIVHIVDLYTTLARVGGAEIPKDRPIDGVDQLDFFLGKQKQFQPRRVSGVRRRPAVCRQMAKLESASGLAGKHVRPAAEASIAEDH